MIPLSIAGRFKFAANTGALAVFSAASVSSSQLTKSWCDVAQRPAIASRRPLLTSAEIEVSSQKPRLMGEDVISELVSAPLSELEVDSALEIWQQSPSLVEDIIGPVLPKGAVVDVAALLEHVRDIVLNKQLLLDVYGRMERKAQDGPVEVVSSSSRVRAAVTHFPEDPIVSQTVGGCKRKHVREQHTSLAKSAEWEAIVESSRCSVCCDLLVAPHVLECHHSFCWECLHNLEMCSMSQKNSNAAEEDVAELLSCPECRKAFTFADAIFELRLDQMILNTVHRAPDCPEKDEWTLRRKRYDAIKAEKKAAAMESEYSFATAEAEEHGDYFDEDAYLPAVFALVMSVVMVVFYLRRSR